MCVRTGLRTIEVSRANIGDISQVGGEAKLFIQGKGRSCKDDIVILTHSTLQPIMEYLSKRKDHQEELPLFISTSNNSKEDHRMTTRSIRRVITSAFKKAHLSSDKLTAHSLRHTAITLSLLGGASIQEAKTMARHEDINTTLIYAQNINRIKDAPERKIDSLLEAE